MTRPRVWAQEILSRGTRRERSALLETVPRKWRPWVRFYVTDAYAKRAASRDAKRKARRKGR